MSILHALTTFSSGTFVVTRTAPGAADAAGKYVDGTTTTYPSVDMGIQPVETERDIKALPKDLRVDDCRLLLTAFDLHINDQVTYKNEQWTVFRVGDWQLRGSSWSRGWMTRNLSTVPA